MAVAGVTEQKIAAESLSAQKIVDPAVARAEAQPNAQADVYFESRVAMSIQSLDAGGKVTNTDLTQYRQYPVNGALFEEVLAKDGRALSALVEFHTKHKLLILAHSARHYQEMGRLVAGTERLPAKTLPDMYQQWFMEAL